MNTLHPHQDYPMLPAGHHALGRQQAHRRRWLGIVLIITGSVWLCLRLTGQVGDMPLLIGWTEGTIAMVERFTSGALAQAACGMLPVYAIRHAR